MPWWVAVVAVGVLLMRKPAGKAEEKAKNPRIKEDAEGRQFLVDE